MVKGTQHLLGVISAQTFIYLRIAGNITLHLYDIPLAVKVGKVVDLATIRIHCGKLTKMIRRYREV
jgi:hypothetical protein